MLNSGPKSSAGTNKELQKKMKHVNVDSAVSTTSILGRNAALLPSGVARLKQSEKMQGKKDLPSTSSSSSATGNPRNKTALAPGHSLMDWIRLGSSGEDLTGVGGVSQVVTLAELAKHNKRNDAWIAIRGMVYNVSRYMHFHPGGVPELSRGIGKDATKLFDDVHAWVNYESILQKCVVGRLMRGGSSNSEKSIANNPTISSNLLSSCIENNADKKAESIASSLRFNWKQTTGAITLSYLPSPNFPAANYRLSRINSLKFRVDIVSDENAVTYEFDFFAEVQWPPNWKRNFETMETEFIFTKAEAKLWKSHGTHTLTHAPASKNRLYKEYEVISNVTLCPLVHLLLLCPKDYLDVVPVGRHVEAKLTVMGMDVSRMYTPVPPCLHPEDMIPAYKPNCICLMVKRYSDGALSPSMTALEPGQTLTLSNGLGTFVVESFDAYTTIHMLAAGTGLTAMLSVIQTALGRRNVTCINLIWFNTDEENIFYSAQLEKVREGGRLKINHVLSQGSESWSGARGTVSDELLSELVGPCTPQGCVLSCGPKGFMEAAKKSLLNLGWKSPQAHEFND